MNAFDNAELKCKKDIELGIKDNKGSSYPIILPMTNGRSSTPLIFDKWLHKHGQMLCRMRMSMPPLVSCR